MTKTKKPHNAFQLAFIYLFILNSNKAIFTTSTTLLIYFAHEHFQSSTASEDTGSSLHFYTVEPVEKHQGTLSSWHTGTEPRCLEWAGI